MENKSHPPFDVVTGMNLGIRSKLLRKDGITDLLGFEPTRAFEKGEKYVGRERVGVSKSGENLLQTAERVRPWGVWHYSTSAFIQSDSLNDHASFLLEKLEAARDGIRQLIGDRDYYVALSIWYVGPAGFGVSSELMARLAGLSEEINVTCWETEEDDEIDQGEAVRSSAQ